MSFPDTKKNKDLPQGVMGMGEDSKFKATERYGHQFSNGTYIPISLAHMP